VIRLVQLFPRQSEMQSIEMPTNQHIRCEADGFEFEAITEMSLMLALKNTGFDIEASCEGSMVCGTCHVRLLSGWEALVQPARQDELDILSNLPGATYQSRLACQIVITPALAGLSIEIAR
jgi:ferredoxin